MRFSTQELRGWADEARVRWHVPGMTVGVLSGGELVTAAAGERRVGSGEAVEPHDVFRIASITKPFVATLVLSLVGDGLLDLDAPVGDATVRQLLSHLGGLQCESPQPIEGVAPGELFSYSNAGFWLVGHEIERVSGEPFEEAMRRRVLEPLELGSTGFDPDGGVPGHYRVRGGDEHRPSVADYPRERRPSGGLWSSVADLLRFASHHLSAESSAELRRPVSSPPGCAHGLGWFLTERGGHGAVEHAGSVGGYQSLLVLLPGLELAFASLTNSSRGSAAIRDVLDRVGLSRRPGQEVALTVGELDAFTGRYASPGVRTLVERGGLTLRLTWSERDPLTREILECPPLVGRPVGRREFEVVDGEWRGEVFGFPRDGFLSFGVLSRRVP